MIFEVKKLTFVTQVISKDGLAKNKLLIQ